MGKRKTYSQEYKQEAVQMLKESDLPISQLARNLGINSNMLRRWEKEMADKSKSAFPGHGTPRDQEIAKLKKELQQVKKERDFLKEAAAFFAKESK